MSTTKVIRFDYNQNIRIGFNKKNILFFSDSTNPNMRSGFFLKKKWKKKRKEKVKERKKDVKGMYDLKP